MIYSLILFPLTMAAVTYTLPSNRWRPWLVPLGALGQLGLVAAVFLESQTVAVAGLGGWLQLDALGKVVLGFIKVRSIVNNS